MTEKQIQNVEEKCDACKVNNKCVVYKKYQWNISKGYRYTDDVKQELARMDKCIKNK